MAERKMEVIDVIESFPHLSWNLKNVIKYILREKDWIRDLGKAENYLHREIHGKWLTENGSVYSRNAESAPAAIPEFPVIVEPLGREDQVKKIVEEFDEWKKSESAEDAAIEFQDFLHAVITYERTHFTHDEILAARKAVIAKNAARGYYGEGILTTNREVEDGTV